MTFSIPLRSARFWALFRLFWKTQARVIWWFPFALALLSSILILANAMRDDARNAIELQSILMLHLRIGVSLSCIIYAGFLFDECYFPGKRRAFIDLPASVLEKYTAKMFLALFVFPVVAILTAWGVLSLTQLAVLEYRAVRHDPIRLSAVLAMLPGLCCGILVSAAAGLFRPRTGFWIFILLWILYGYGGFWLDSLLRGSGDGVRTVGLSHVVTTPGLSPEAYRLGKIYEIVYFLPFLLFGVSVYFQIREKEA
jgi:hypothetical protein